MSDLRSGATVSVGDSLGCFERTPTRVGMFLFGVAHWTAHRIHYDTEWARREGYADVLVPGPLMSAWLVELVTQWAGSPRALVSMEDRNRATAHPGDVLTVSGEVVDVDHDAEGTLVTCATRVRSGDDDVVTGRHVVRLPR
jgi:hydroxyacyl-ACP dehydratase HTD2-like protein with hotdog domain